MFSREFWLDTLFMLQAVVLFIAFSLVVIFFFLAILSSFFHINVDPTYYAFMAILASAQFLNTVYKAFVWIEKKAVEAYEEAEYRWL
jgi:hypothetical protein